MTAYFMTPPEPGFNTLAFDFDRDVACLQQVGALNDATSTLMNTYAARGGKLIVFQGVSDPRFFGARHHGLVRCAGARHAWRG